MNRGNNCIKINKLFLLAVVFLFALICFKLVYIAVSPKVDGIDLKKFALSRTTVTKKIIASRGTIYDTSGEILAQNVRSYTVIAYLDSSRTTDKKNPQHVVDKEMTAEKLSTVLGISKDYILNLLNSDAYQVELGPKAKGITELLKQEIEALDLPGIDFIKGEKRDYPYGDFASYIVGYARKDDSTNQITGEMGIEANYDAELKGKDGEITYQKDAYGYKIANTPEIVSKAEEGYDIYLTIDTNVQMYLENAMDQIESLGADWATMTIADANTGAIIGSASLPSFNPNVLEISDYNSPLTSYAYEPGSTMKIFSFMAAMEEGKYVGTDTYKSGSIIVDDFKISDWNKYGWGDITFDTGFTYSSNVAAVTLAQKIGKDKLMDYYTNFGFGSKTGIELPNEYTGKLDFIYASELANAAFGQGITTTPVQNIQALTSLTNKGIILKPYIVSKIVDSSNDKIVYEGKRTEVKRVVSENTVNQMINLMDLTVNGDDPEATGKKYQTDSVRLIGKTGTAQYTLANGKYSSGNNNIRSFSGIFPKDNPEYIIYFSVKRFLGESSQMGDIVKNVVNSIAKYRNLDSRVSDEDTTKIVKMNNYVSSSKNEASEKVNALGLVSIVLGDGNNIIKQYPLKNSTVLVGNKVFLLTNGTNYLMPDITGWTRSEVVSFANMINLNYTMDGYGKVTAYSIKAGDPIDLTSTLAITLGG
jgi:penicillin-binding protein 2B